MLGTAHLQPHAKQLKRSSLAAMLDTLARFQPDRIAIENLPGETVEFLDSRSAKPARAL